MAGRDGMTGRVAYTGLCVQPGAGVTHQVIFAGAR